MDEFHIPRKKNFAQPPAEAASSSAAAATASSSQTKGDDGAAGDIAMTPSKSKSSEPTMMSSPDKSPGGRKILRRGDLVRLSNEQKSGRIQGGLARIARIQYAKGASADQPTSDPIYDIEYILGGKVSNVERNELEYTTATAEGLIDTDDGTRGLRRKRPKRMEEELTTKQKEKASKKQKDRTSKKKQDRHVTTTDETPTKRKRGRPPKNPKKATVETAVESPESTTKRPRNANSDFERPPTSRQLANMEKEGEVIAESPKPKKKKKSDAAMVDRIPTSRQLANMEYVDEPVEYLQPTKKSGKANTNATAKSAGKRKNTRASKDASQRNLRRSSSRATETSESGADTTSEDPNETRRLNLYAKHRNEMEKSIQRLQKMDRYGFFLENPPSDLDEDYDYIMNADSSDDDSDSDDEGAETSGRKIVTFPDQPPYNFLVLKKRFAAGRYDLDMVALEQERRSNIKSMLGATSTRPSSSGDEDASITSPEDEHTDEADYSELANTMIHPLAVDWDTLKSDVSAMCDAAMIRDPEGASLGTGHLGFTAKKVKELMEEMYNTYGGKRKLEVEESEVRQKYKKVLINCGNMEAAMQGKWRKAAFPERKYQRLETASVICDGLSNEDKSYAMYELQTTLPDSFVGLAYMYDDAGQQSETWMKTVADETSKSNKRKKKKKTDDNDATAAEKENEKAEEAAKALAKDDGVTRTQLQTTMHTLKIQVQDRVMTDLGVMYQPEARSANWNDGDKDRNYDGGDAEVEQGGNTTNDKDASSKWEDSSAEVAEQEVWGIDCYTRKNVMVVIESEFTPEIATEFVEKWLPPAINACPVNLAHNMSMAARILEGLSLPDDGSQGSPSEDNRGVEDTAVEEDSYITSDAGIIDRSETNTPVELENELSNKAAVVDSSKISQLLDAAAKSSSLQDRNCLPSKNENSVFLRNALKEKIASFGPPWLKAAARLIRLTVDSMEDDFFRIHPKGHGSVVIEKKGLNANSLVTYYRGEVFPAWRWCEKLDAIEYVQKELGLRPNLPDFYNMAMERPMKDPRGYSLLFVDASRKSGLGSSFSHSCNPTCEVRVVALNGKLSLAMTTLRDLEVGEELTFDYNAVTESLNEYRFAICLCGHKNCRGSFLHFATADCYQQVLSRNSPIAARFANLVRGCMKQVMSKEDSELLAKHGFSTAAFGAVSFNHHTASADSNSTQDSIENVPIWLRTFVADCLRYTEYERRALPVALLCNQMDRIDKSKKEEKAKKKQKPKPVPKKEKPEPAEKSKSISGSRPKTSWMFFLDCKRDDYKSVVQKKHGSKLKGLEFAQEVSREASKAFKKLSDEQKEVWKKKAIADWKKNGGEEKAKQEEERQKALGKKVPTETMVDDSKEESVPRGNDSSFEAKTISFADADAEGFSAMEQRIQQLAQSLSRVGRVLDRHRESVFRKSTDPIFDVNSDVLRNFVPTPLKIMSDKDLVDWMWEDPKGIINNLFSLVEKSFPSGYLLRGLLSATKVKYKLRLTNKNNSDAKKVTKEALLQFRKNILDFLVFADESMNEARKEKNREKDRLRREKANKQETKQQDVPAAASNEEQSNAEAGESSQTTDVQVEYVPSNSQEITSQKESSSPSTFQSNQPISNVSVLDEQSPVDEESGFETDKREDVDDDKPNLSSDEAMHIRGGGDFPTPEDANQHSTEEVVQHSAGVSADVAPFKSPHASEARSQSFPLQFGEQKPLEPASNSPGLGLLAQALTTVGFLQTSTKSSLQENLTEHGKNSSGQNGVFGDGRQLHNGVDHMQTEKFASSSGAAFGAQLSSGSNTNNVASKNIESTEEASTEITPSSSSAETHVPSNTSTIGTNHDGRKASEYTSAPSMDLLLSATKHVLPDHASSIQEPTNTAPAAPPSSPPKKKAPPMSQDQVAYLRNWIIEHASNPYPTPEEKDVMIEFLGIERKRLDSWLVRNRRALLGGDREIKMKWDEKNHEHWTGFRKKRYMLESTADLLLMYANTSTFFMMEPFCRFDSTAIEVYARELGNAVPLRFALDSPCSEHLSDQISMPKQKEEQSSGGMSGTRRKKEKEKQKDTPNDAAVSPEENFCSPDDVIDNVTVDYSGDYVLSQLLQWVNGGIGQAKGLPDFFGCVTLPPISGCWEEVECDEVKLPNYTRYNKAKATEYVAKIRPKLAEWFLNRYQRGSPWDKDLAKFFCSANASAPDPTMPMGSPIIDYLITGMDENIKKISAALKGKEEESDETKSKRSKLSTSDRLQSTVDEGMPAQAVANWVQCEDPKCLKWRKLPWHVDVDLLPDKFYCKDNVWNPNRQTCDSTEDDWDMDDAPIKFDSNQNFEVGAWFDVQREGKIGYSEAQVVELDFNSNVKRVKFTFYRLKNDRDEWVEVGSPRIAPHHSYTPRPFIGGASTKKYDTSAGGKRKVDDVESQEDSGAKSLMALSSKPVNDYLNTWMALHAANPIPTSDEKIKIMSDTGLSESQLDDWMRTRKKPKKKKDDGLTEEERKEKDLKKKVNEEMNNFLSAWLLRPENVQSNPIAAATPTAEAKEWMAKQLGVDRARIDSWFYRRRKKLKKQHMPDIAGQSSNPAAGDIPQLQPQPQPQPQTQSIPTSAPSIAKPPPASPNQVPNPNLNLPSNHQRPQNQTALTASTQVSMSVNQQLPSTGQSQVAAGEVVSAESLPTGAPSSKQSGLSDEAKQYLTQWLLKTTNPYPSKEMKDKIMAHFGIENTRTLDGFLTRTRKKLNLQNKQSSMRVNTTTLLQPASTSTATHPGASAQMNQSQAAMASRIAQPTQPTQAPVARIPQPSQPLRPSSGVPAQLKSTQNLTASKFQSTSSALPMQSSNLDSLLTAVELVNSQKQYTQPQPSRQQAPNQIGQTRFAPSSSAMGPGSSQYRQSSYEQQHRHQQQHQQQQQHQHQQQQQQQRFSRSPVMVTGNPSRQQLVQNGTAYHSGQQRQFSHSPTAPQYQPAPTREQSILMAYQNLQEMEIHDRSSNRSSPAEATARPMQSDQGNPQHNSVSNITTTANGSQAYRENQQQPYGDNQQQYVHGQNPNK